MCGPHICDNPSILMLANVCLLFHSQFNAEMTKEHKRQSLVAFRGGKGGGDGVSVLLFPQQPTDDLHCVFPQDYASLDI